MIGFNPGSLVTTPLFLLIGIAAAILFLYFALLTGILLYAERLGNHDRRAQATRILQPFVGWRRAMPVWYRSQIFEHLIHWLAWEKQYQRAIDLAELAAGESIAPASRANMLRLKAESLEALGRGGEAQAAMAQAQSILRDSEPGWESLSAEAQLMAKQGRIPEAYRLYKEALAYVPVEVPAARVPILAHLATNSLLGGEPESTLRWARELLELANDPVHRCSAYRLAAVGASHSRDLDLAERFIREGIAYARSVGREDKVAEMTAYLATILGRRPDPEAAMALLDELTSGTGTGSSEQLRTVWTHKAEMLYNMGRFQEGIEAARQTQRLNTQAIPTHRRRFEGLSALLLARGYISIGSVAESQRYVLEAAACYAGNEKMTTWCQAAHLYGAALAGDAQATRDEAGEVLERLKAFPNADDLKRTCYSYIARAAWKLQDWEACRWNTQAYQGFPLAPSETAMPLFLLGECARAESDETAAREFYTQAAAVHPELYWSKMAAAALSSAS